ncbi:MAG TPA: RDD family protein [Zoogloea sp.]|uniref:RDD family protein n=1 Tax=Zoogloea sp. TaxID=49181 RepID=UPI002B77BBDB|nr:RDD family protein [Zoogloea sp.]HMV62942.1 RDD family protein [Rhodocyclaceae bacterium]HMW52594.1 RDD family protein [Rhodocyclaceae bacterium]HMY48303.1 RDD family protein [Rhodocyclaceae bacterium]HMZ76559.1 RDD family protein [Rhodocyclaceae bacterium]HNB63686.1 RDD family protein [Rhodocyclaceae bacterium]
MMPSTATSGATPRPTGELATLRRRLASMLYEVLLLLGVLALTFLVPLLILGIGFGILPPGGVMWLWIYLALGGYFVWYWRQGGQTLAMQTWKLRIVAANGDTVSVRQAWLRYSLAWASLCVGGLGLFWALIDPERQFLHDRLAGTRIVLLLAPPAD